MKTQKLILLALLGISVMGSAGTIIAQQKNSNQSNQQGHKCNGKCKH